MNIVQVFEQFPTQASCITHLEKARWGNTPHCPYCQSEHAVRSDNRHFCYSCKTSFSVTVGTIFHHTHMPLQKWFLAISLILNAKKGLSALQLSPRYQGEQEHSMADCHADTEGHDAGRATSYADRDC